jgi:hypothetical protein
VVGSTSPSTPTLTPFRKILFIGESGRGKTTAARQLLAGSRLSVAVVNDGTAGDPPEGYRRVDWKEVLRVRGCNVLAEDLIAVKKPQLEVLQRLLNFNAHHHELPNVILISHGATSNGIFPIFKHLTHICFMTVGTVPKTVETVLGEILPKEARDEKVAAFETDPRNDAHGYWVYDVETRAFEPKPGSLAAAAAGGYPPPAAAGTSGGRESLLAPYRKTAQTYLNLFSENPRRALAIFDFLMTKTPLQPLAVADLNFTLRDAKSGRVVSVSLLDYIHTLTTQTTPTKDILDLHSYLRRHVTLPRCFIANHHRKFSLP